MEEDFVGKMAEEFEELPTSEEVSPKAQKEQAAKDRIKNAPIEKAVDEWMEFLQKSTGDGIQTGWDRVDEAFGDGMQVEEVILIAARTGVGKSWILQSIAERELERLEDMRALFLTLEMSGIHLGERIAIHAGGMSPMATRNAAKSGDLTTEQLMSFAPYLHRMAYNENMLLLEEVGDAIAAASELLGGPVKLVCIDYLGLLRMKGSRGRLYEVVSEVSRQLKEFAKAQKVVILVAAQLSREGGKSGQIEPHLDALRDSGVTEEAADRILMAWQERLIEDDEDEEPLIKIKVAKNRFGPTTGPLTLAFDDSMRLIDTTDEMRQQLAMAAVDKLSEKLDDIPF